MMPYSTSSEQGSAGVPGPRALGAEEFRWLRRTVKAASGIHLAADRASIASARIAKRVRATGSNSFADYIAHVERDTSGEELWSMIDALTVNQTSFFREPEQYPVYLGSLRELLRRHETLNVWSAGCSTGEEIFTLAMLAHCLLPGAAARLRFLGTDISPTVLRTARAGIYDVAGVQDLPPLVRPLFDALDDGTGRVRVAARVRESVRFARHNLIGVWRMRGPMHVIFCRNVLFYFDRPTQRRVIDAFCQILAPGGYLFLGATESVAAGTPLRALQSAVYRKLPLSP